MKKKIASILCVAVASVSLPLAAEAQTADKEITAAQLYQSGRQLFENRAYSAAVQPLNDFVKHFNGRVIPADKAGEYEEAEYMLLYCSARAKESRRVEKCKAFLRKYPDTSHKSQIYGLMGTALFYEGKYNEAVVMLRSAKLELLPDSERDELTYLMAVSYLKLGKVKEAAVWFDTLLNGGNSHKEDCRYYLSYISYSLHDYDKAEEGFTRLLQSQKYGALSKYYLAEINLAHHNSREAIKLAASFIDSYPQDSRTAEMYRVWGEADYQLGDYHACAEHLSRYVYAAAPEEKRRDALYILGVAYYKTRVYSKVPEVLFKVLGEKDALSQSAYYYSGLAYLQLAEKNKARMAFEQAAYMNDDREVKELAAYNYALTLHETSYSAFGESVTAFENFLNKFPNSRFSDEISSYLVDVYLTSRSYDAALQSIERIAHPSQEVLIAKARILFQLGTQEFANSNFEEAINRFTQTILTAKSLHGKADMELSSAVYWRGEACYRLGKMQQAKENFKNYLSRPVAGSEMTALAYYNLGYIAFQNRGYVEARDNFLKFVDNYHGDQSNMLADAYNRIGDCYLERRSFDEAVACYMKSKSLQAPSSDYAYYQLALVAGLQKNYALKAEILSQLIADYPKSPLAVDALYQKGRSYVQEQKMAPAIECFNQLLTDYPNSPLSRKAAAEIGLLYYQTDQYDKAIEAYKKVIAQYPGSDEAKVAMRDLKSIYVDANRVGEFAELAKSMPADISFEANEQDSLTYVAAEKVYMRGQKMNARRSFENYLQVYPKGAYKLNAHYYLAVIDREMKQNDGALEHLNVLMEYPDNPYSEQVLAMRGQLLFDRGDYDAALGDYRLLQAKATNDIVRMDALIGAFKAAVALKDDIEIVKVTTRLLEEPKLEPEMRRQALYFRAKAYIGEEADKKAVADLAELSKDTRTTYGAEARYLMAQLYFRSGEYNKAEKVIMDFINQSTPHLYWLARSFVLLSDIYMTTGRDEEARQYLESLKQNYKKQDDIQERINVRLQKLNEK